MYPLIEISKLQVSCYVKAYGYVLFYDGSALTTDLKGNNILVQPGLLVRIIPDPT